MTKRELKELVKKYADRIETFGVAKYYQSQDDDELGVVRVVLKEGYVSAMNLETTMWENDYETLRTKLHVAVKVDNEKYEHIKKLVKEVATIRAGLIENELAKTITK